MTAKPSYEPDAVDAAVRATLKAVASDRGVYRYMVTLGAAFGLMFLAMVAMYGKDIAARGIEATTSTTWGSSWTGSQTSDSVETPLYQGQDERSWGEKHKALVRQAMEGRP